MQAYFKWSRALAVAKKEVKELFNDPITLLMVFLLPLIEVVLFAYAINNNPKHLPLAVVSSDNSPITRSILTDMQISSYFKVLEGNYSSEEANRLFRRGKALFAAHIPPNFTKELIRGNNPELLIEADGTDPAAVSYALGALSELSRLFTANLSGSLDYLKPQPPQINFVVHTKFNPNRITQYNIVPGLLSAVLSMTLVLITAITLVRETEAGTMEMLLTTPLTPTEIIVGKIIPYIVMAYMQAIIILVMAYFVFTIPIHGSITLLMFACLPFILACLVLGILFSTRAENQFQAAQATTIYFLPSLLFSGFMFPYDGLPNWGKFIGNLLPSTHFLVIIRGIMLKGSTLADILPSMIAILIIFFVLLALAIARFRQTLD